DVFNARMREFQRRYDTLDNRVQLTRQGLQQSYNDAMTKVENTALQIIADIAAERKANLVLAKAAVQLAAPQIAPSPAPRAETAPGNAPPLGALPQPPR